MTDNDIEHRLQRTIESAYGPEAGCPTPRSWHRAAAGELPAEERMRLTAHAADCPACAAERDLAALFAAGPDPSANAALGADLAAVVARLEAHPPHRTGATAPADRSTEPATPAPAAAEPGGGRLLRFPRRGGTVAAALAAAAALALAVGLGLRTTEVPPALPDRPPGDPVRGGVVTDLAPAGELESAPDGLRWAAVEDAAGYRVTLLAADDTLLWQGETPAPPLPLPPAVMPLSSGVRYQWRVEAVGSDGRTVARSGLVGFRIRPMPDDGQPIPRHSGARP